MNRQSSTISDSSSEKSSLTPNSSTQTPDMEKKLVTNPEKRLSRQNTFVLEGRPTPENDEMASPNEGMTVVLDHLPDNLKPYISMHFRMIREENEDLLQMMESKEEELENIKFEHQKCLDNEKALERLKKDFEKLNSQHEREKVKTKAMIKNLKEQQNTSKGTNKDLVWYGMEGKSEPFEENGLKLQERKNNQQSISNRKRSAKMRQRNRSSQTVNNDAPENYEELVKIQALLKQKERILNDVKDEHKNCVKNEKAHNRLKIDFENLSIQLKIKENEIVKQAKQLKTSNSQTSRNEEDDDREKRKMKELLAIINEKDITIENLKQQCCNYQDKELEHTELKRNYQELKSLYENNKNDPMPTKQTRSSQTNLDDVAEPSNVNTEVPPNKNKPYVSQLESLKTEMESLRKVKSLHFGEYVRYKHFDS